MTARVQQGPLATILVVEDEEAIRLLLCHLLERYGYSALGADAADSAMNIWHTRRHEIDLLLTDICMPGDMNGLDLAKQLAADKPELKIALISGYCAEYFGNAQPRPKYFLQKPFGAKALIEMVEHCLAD